MFTRDINSYLKTQQLSIGILMLCLLTACSKPIGTITPLSPEATVLAFGDSLTYGYGATHEDSYPTQLATLINRNVVNAGISGEISQAGLARLPGLLAQHDPELVILCHGGNDILQKKDLAQTKSNLVSMIELIHQHGAIVLLVAVPAPSLLLSNVPMYEEIATELNIAFQPSAMKSVLGQTSLKKDLTHPNAKGNAAIAEAILETLQSYEAI